MRNSKTNERFLYRLAIVADFKEERWPSMDRVAESLFRELSQVESIYVELIRPKMVRVFSILPKFRANSTAFNLDRFFNRFFFYPLKLFKVRRQFDIFHIIDHSYSHLVHVLRSNISIVTCHDIDTFMCLIKPESDDRKFPFKLMTKVILSGFKKASWIHCVSRSTLDDILRYKLVEESLTSVCHNGVDDAFFASPEEIIAPNTLTLIHVGSTIPRKCINFLLKVLAGLIEKIPKVRLIRVGGNLTNDQLFLARSLGVDKFIHHYTNVSDQTLRRLVSQSTLMLFPSRSEGFGLPLIESMASGTPVLCSDIPVLREVGLDSAEYAIVEDLDDWVNKACSLLDEAIQQNDLWQNRRNLCRLHAKNYSWAKTAEHCLNTYRRYFPENKVL